MKVLAELGAGAHGARRTGALSRGPDAVAALKKYLQVQVAITAGKARAQLLLQRVSFVGRSFGGNPEAPLHIQGFWISG